ncbi:FCD domain-containing protein [Enterovibrio sp. ZSDZ35]|uniref:FCD domain-containing protein n=1 Tax=Enterovibrio qingdaonensis TaxID=2899818 RepID=A0ABT5QJ30_9GAMM|nr:FCD domain-containing protein [Enterovibrio sp. ZSDZ35]MDD1780987.1 FCD domain-containing protein [Enterovibrio sp. ZSDZ35]
MDIFAKNSVPTLKKKKLSDHVADELERMIINNTLKEGDTLPSERDLMDAFNVGRPSVREALQRLSQKGLVEIKSGEKTRVTRPSMDTVISNVSGMAIGILSQAKEKKEFEQLRQLFEVAIVREAARNRTEDDLKRLELALLRNKNSLGDYDEFVKTDVDFHIAIIQCINNPIATNLYTTFIDWLIKARSKELYSEQHEKNYQHHCEIFDAIKSGDADIAEQAMNSHLKFVVESTS